MYSIARNWSENEGKNREDSRTVCSDDHKRALLRSVLKSRASRRTKVRVAPTRSHTPSTFTKPETQGHVKPPGWLTQKVFCWAAQVLLSRHSLMSTQSMSLPNWYPDKHAHSYDPTRFVHAVCSPHLLGVHSSTSSQEFVCNRCVNDDEITTQQNVCK